MPLYADKFGRLLYDPDARALRGCCCDGSTEESNSFSPSGGGSASGGSGSGGSGSGGSGSGGSGSGEVVWMFSSMSLARNASVWSRCTADIISSPATGETFRGDYSPIGVCRQVIAASEIQVTGDFDPRYECTCAGQKLENWQYQQYESEEDVYTCPWAIDACPSLGTSRITHILTITLIRLPAA